MIRAPAADNAVPEGSAQDASTPGARQAPPKDESPLTPSYRQGELLFLMVRCMYHVHGLSITTTVDFKLQHQTNIFQKGVWVGDMSLAKWWRRKEKERDSYFLFSTGAIEAAPAQSVVPPVAHCCSYCCYVQVHILNCSVGCLMAVHPPMYVDSL